MNTVIKPLGILVLALLLAAAMAGCGTTPLGPATPATSAPQVGALSPPIVHVNADGSGTLVQVSSLPRLSGTDGSVKTTSAKIDGNKGGSVCAGRFTVTVPPGAFIGPATITISVPSQSTFFCDLSIAPLAANNFKVPVTLTTDIKDLGLDASTLTTYWYDPVQARWVAMPTSTDAKGEKLFTSLNHFSIYATGKAGW